MSSDAQPERATILGIPRILAVFILLFWIAQFSLLTAQRMAFVEDERATMLLPRAFVTLVAIAMSFAMAKVQARLHGRSPQVRVAAAVGLAVVAAPLHSAVNFVSFQIFEPELNMSTFNVMSYVSAVASWLWSYAAASGMIYALLANFEVIDREGRIGQLERVASEAQLRALRYQLNPHFMFNTLNSITALIGRGQSAEAETMVENLADFLRTGLSLDPLDDIPLAREIELQSLYLAIEKVRFADRLRVRMDIEREAERALVPSLVTQPLIENAIRHAVSATADVVEIAISASVRDGSLRFAVVNNVPDTPSARRGTGVGLVNVENRLRLRFGQDVTFTAGMRPDGHYEVRFAVPDLRDSAA